MVERLPDAATGGPSLAPLSAIESTLAAIRARLGDAATHALHPGLVLDPEAGTGWLPATRLTDGTRLPDLIDAAKQRWAAQPHAAAALAWKSYTYWLALPAVVGYAAARRVPLLRPADVLINLTDYQPFLTVGMRRAAVAVLPSDPLANVATPDVQVVRDEPALLAALRESLLDAHLDPLLEQIRGRVNLGRRTLLGSLAAGVASGIRLARADAGPPDTIGTTLAVLTALDVADLVTLSASRSGMVHIQRHTCCLAFTLPVPKICSGCCLR